MTSHLFLFAPRILLPARLTLAGILLASVGALGGCEKLASLAVGNPSDFLNAWTAKQREIETKKWKPMVGPAVLARLAPGISAAALSKRGEDSADDKSRNPLSRCVGLTDAALLRCLSTLGRLREENIPVFEACAGPREGDREEIYGCAEFAYARSGDDRSFGACRFEVAGASFACVVGLTRKLAAVPVQADLLGEIALWNMRDAFRQDAQTVLPALARAEENDVALMREASAFMAPASDAPGAWKGLQASAAIRNGIDENNTTPQGINARGGEEGDEDEVLDADARKALCDTHFSAGPESECHRVLVEEAHEAMHLTREAARLCTFKEGLPKDDALSLGCLRAAARRLQNAASLAPCALAFDRDHPGYLAFVKNCVAGAGFRLFDTSERRLLARALSDAPAASLGANSRLLESYEEIRRKVREEAPVANEEP